MVLRTSLFLLALACVALVACDSGGAGGGGATPTADMGDVDDQGGCAPGELGCACAEDDLCSQGNCLDGLCVDCEVGDLDCLCFRNDTCSGSLRCNEGTSRCEECPAGEQGCACSEEGCRDGLICSSQLCVPETCGNSPGRVDCPCDVGNVCNEGLTCTEAGMCAPCSSDIEGCPCDDEGECGQELVCDQEEELCREALACADLECALNQQCEEGGEGVDAHCLEACLPGYRWNAVTGACDRIIVASCTLGAEGNLLEECAGRNRECVTLEVGAECGACLEGFTDGEGALEACREVLTCASLECEANHRGCQEEGANSDAACGACLDGYEEQDGVCVLIPVANCVLGDPNSILSQCADLNRVCVEGVNSDAACGACLDGFTLDELGACVPQVLCADLDCASRGRECVGAPLASCGGCLPNTVLSDPLDAESDCRDVYTCDSVGSACDINTDCQVGQCLGESGCAVGQEGCEDLEGRCGCEGSFCVANEGVDAFCSQWPCTFANGEPNLNQALRQETGECVDCNISCGEGEGTGQTGNFWPYTLQGGRCLCETLPGYYADIGTAVLARPCDEDGDGWTRSGARSALASEDPVLAINARCSVRSIDRFHLVNELGQEKVVMLCDAGEVAAEPCTSSDECGVGRCFGDIHDCPLGVEGCEDTQGTCGCLEAAPVPLYETERNDDQGALDIADAALVPPYTVGEQGRPLQARELNSLTRACVSELGDFNDNDISDVSEWQQMEGGQGAMQGADAEEAALQEAYLRFSYFTELHRGWYERDPGAEYGRYFIAERSRCDESFPLGYDEADGDYWRQCTRNRDTGYRGATGEVMVGFDFARYSCQAEEGSCPLAEPLVEVSVVGEVSPHGLCEVSLPPSDGVWRGMNHHSQFKCAVIDLEAPEEPSLEPQVYVLDELNSSQGDGRYQFNRCYVDPESQTQGEVNPEAPELTCAPVVRSEVTSNDVGFVSVRYNPLAYDRGCINEWSNWPQLCPGYTNNPQAVTGDGHKEDSGRLICGCGFNFGGPECDQGCPGGKLFYSGTRGDEEGNCSNGYCSLLAGEGTQGRSGFWMCAGFEASAYSDQEAAPQSEAGGYLLRGAVPQVGIGRSGPMCQDDADCNSGWSLR